MSEESVAQWAEQHFHHTFTDESLLVQALTHSTYANEQGEPTANNERLEFLGDAVLELLVSHELYLMEPDAREGALSKQRSFLVRRESLAAVARSLHVHLHLRLGEGQRQTSGDVNDRLMANGFEAVFGAIFMDGGYAAAANAFVHIAPIMHALNKESVEDYKGQLQELCHRLEKPAPEYNVVNVEGPDHNRVYHCAVHIDNSILGEGQATSRKAAEQICARLALQQIEQ